jgi:hypothetical protein
MPGAKTRDKSDFFNTLSQKRTSTTVAKSRLTEHLGPFDLYNRTKMDNVIQIQDRYLCKLLQEQCR